jgi:transcriptional regulator with PAS, ATPase and Fis domain
VIDPNPAPVTNAPNIVAQSQIMTDLLAEVRRLAQTDAKVLITGESGVGKELIASYIHAAGRRASRPFVAVNCAGLPETLLESELFGHVKGSFTGAYRDKPGKFELAHTGTLFLDEVGEMTLRMQGLLLRVLETGELQKVGAGRWTARVDARVLAATNRNLAELIQRGLFREDLYYRLNVVQVHVPPLRERTEDIPLLVDLFLRRLAKDAEIECRCRPDFYQALQAYRWPGNVRQLENVVQRLVINSRDGLITADDLPPEIRAEAALLLPQPRQERRRTVGDLLYERLRSGGMFWDVVYRPYMSHELTKTDVRAVVHKGLEEARGNYRVVTKLFNIPPTEYKRFLTFLRKHDCLLPYREYR